MLTRVLEPEVMDSEADAREYDSMDHAAVNAVFVADLMNALTDWPLQRPVPSALGTTRNILDLGTGTAQIPIELCRRFPSVRVIAVDAAESMLALARQNVAVAGLSDRIEMVLADAKRLPFSDGTFTAVISNSIAHHIAEPGDVLAEAVRVAALGALQFHRDLARPTDEATLEHLVATYAGSSTAYQRRLFGESMRAALTLEEIQSLVTQLGGSQYDVRMTSDRHWTWIAKSVA